MKVLLLPGKERNWIGGENNLLKEQRNSISLFINLLLILQKNNIKHYGKEMNMHMGINDFFKEVEQNLYKVQYRVLLSRYRGRTLVRIVKATVRKEALYVKVDGKHIGELCEMPVKDLKAWFDELDKKLSDHDKQVAKRILIEIHHRLNTLLNVGLGLS